jgi:hypothetical protein
MQTIGDTLARLPDNETRVRVLQWATARLRKASEQATTAGSIPVRAPQPVSPASKDPIVSIEGLTEMFPNLALRIRRDQDENLRFDGLDERRASPEPLDRLIRTLADDLGQFAVDWQRA